MRMMPLSERLGTLIAELSCCVPYTRYGNCVSVVRW